MHDVAVVGLGPAGRALAGRCAAQGLRVLAVDPEPDRPWSQTLCLWLDQLPPWLIAAAGGAPEAVVAAVVDRPVLRARTRHVVDRPYAVLDTAALRRVLAAPSPLITERAARVDDPRELLGQARRVVDCRGAGAGGRRRVGRGDRGAQTAAGIVVPAVAAVPALAGAPALFMDWVDDHGDADTIGPTFLYAIPLGGDRVLLEETCLASSRPPSPERLRRRLESRLRARGVDPAVLAEPLARERVVIPLLPPRRGPVAAAAEGRHGIGRFGAAGGHVHPMTGYSIAASLAAAPWMARAVATGTAFPPVGPRATRAAHRAGLRALLHAGAPTTLELFEAFGSLPTERQRSVMDPAVPPYRVIAAMTGLWHRMPGGASRQLVAATAGLPTRG